MRNPSLNIWAAIQGSHCLYFVHMFYLHYIIIVLLILSPGECKLWPITLNMASNGQELSWQCSIFTLRQSEHASLPHGLMCDVIGHTFLFWNIWFLCHSHLLFSLPHPPTPLPPSSTHFFPSLIHLLLSLLHLPTSLSLIYPLPPLSYPPLS